MIVVDGREAPIEIAQFQNLEQILLTVMSDEYMNDRVVTDVLLNQENFSEIYPHQAEDIPASEVKQLEIVTMGVNEMAVNITRELYKVVTLMDSGAKKVSGLFRQADDAEALEMYQDLLDVTRDFFSMVAVLRDEFTLKQNKQFGTAVDDLSNLFGEMLEVTENEDWILLSDLLEYEYIPAVQRWKQVIAKLREDIRDVQ
ncbi:hypothetical protein dsx2_2572 [Desulfovibrio sp. X2]|uniref:hypothetical protein n=1 Tax=Desulfovibrio sp. X2 TaxID=941449 RepID=UPI000358AF11|nr:hypothetical protein [Desulfovibrio sp. X2]EPR42655.1 hypothetical protein dsx2_2572 [Desulfovibrio sp. X2]